MYCNQEIETMARAEMTQLQTMKLQKLSKWIYEKSSFYQKKLNMAGLTDTSIQSLADLQRVPFTTKAELIAQSPYGLLTSPLSSTIRLRWVGGEQEEIVRSYTSGDVARNVEMAARGLMAGGVNMASVLQILADHASENALGVQYAGEVLGATVIPSCIGDSSRLLQMIDRLGVTVLAGSYQQLLRLLAASNTVAQSLENSGIKTVFVLNHMVKNHINRHLGDRFSAKLFNFYAPLELGCAAIAFDCEHNTGLHLQEDNFYAEVIDLKDQMPVPEGQVGELVLTTLALESMPVLRYRTGQMASLNKETCACGRTLLRIKAV